MVPIKWSVKDGETAAYLLVRHVNALAAAIEVLEQLDVYSGSESVRTALVNLRDINASLTEKNVLQFAKDAAEPPY